MSANLTPDVMIQEPSTVEEVSVTKVCVCIYDFRFHSGRLNRIIHISPCDNDSVDRDGGQRLQPLLEHLLQTPVPAQSGAPQ